ncbi:MAG: hypothetical protein OXD30_04395 [Bryobacterales bacterium]|nr:hypothetical protein [Bryobacterales bacterium]
MFHNMLKRRFVECRIGVGHEAEVDDPPSRRPSRQVHAIYPWFQNVRIGPAVGIGRPSQPIPSLIARNVEPAIPADSEKSLIRVYLQTPRQSDIGACVAASGRQIGVDLLHELAIESTWDITITPTQKTHERDSDGGTIDDPRLVRPSIEDRGLLRNPIKYSAVLPASDGVGCD